MYKTMIVDDEENVLKALKRLLVAVPCFHEGVTYKLDVETYTSPVAALEQATKTPYALVISDYRMPEMNGAEFLKQVRLMQPNTVRMILSGYSDLNGLVNAINEAQISRFIAKPWNDYELISAIGQSLAYRNLLLENLKLADECRVEHGLMSQEALARKRQAESQPGAKPSNHWAEDGSAVFDESSNWYG